MFFIEATNIIKEISFLNKLLFYTHDLPRKLQGTKAQYCRRQYNTGDETGSLAQRSWLLTRLEVLHSVRGC